MNCQSESQEEKETLKREKATQKKARQRARKSAEDQDKVREKDRIRKSKPEAKEARKLREGTEEAKEKDRQRKNEDRMKMPPNKLDDLRRSERLRKIQGREAMTVDQEAIEREEARMRMETHRRVLKSKVTLKDGLRNQEVLCGTFPVQKLENSFDSIGKMDIKCQECGALKFKRETPGFCCSDGKVKIKPFPRPPEDLAKLWFNKGRTGNILKKFSRELNNALALSSIKVSLRQFQGFNPSVVFQGKVAQLTGALLPADGEAPRFSQLYCYDPRLESYQRFENMNIPSDTSRAEKEELKTLLQKLQDLMHKHNPFVRDFKMILEMPEEDLAHGKIVISASQRPPNEHARRYNPQTNLQEVSILTNESPHDLVLHRRGGGLTSIHDLNPKGMPLHFTLLFPYGTYGWDQYEKQASGTRRVTTKQFYAFHLQIRKNENMNFLMQGERLFQEWCCMAWVLIENQRLNYQRQNQKALRADSYKSVREATEERIREAGPRSDELLADDHQRPGIGRKILAGSHVGSPRYMNAKNQDGMAILREYRKPDLFITMTCNPNWPEIQAHLTDGQKPQDRPDLVTRAFKLKKDQLMRDLINGQLLGKVDAFLWTIEFQKRGLPHCHLLLILSDHDRLITPSFVDNVISAEIPPSPDDVEDEKQKEERRVMEEIVLNNMIHGPCGADGPTKPCMENGKCTKGFPKPFVQETMIDPESNYATYRRRSPQQGGRKVKHNGKEIDNRWIVPFNAYLSKRFNCHINVECCCSEKSVKYLCKYVNKGNDRAAAAVHVEGQPRDEIAEYEDMRSVGSSEACWHIFGFPIHDRFPPVLALRVHLHEEQQIVFDENTEMDALENQRETELTAFFEFNRKAIRQGCAPEELPKYVEMPKKYRYDKKSKEWVLRKQKGDKVIGRVHSVHPVCGDKFYLRTLLHDKHCKGKVSFEDLLKLQDGRVCETFKEVCREIGLLNDDLEWQKILEEAAATKMCPEIRELYVTILFFCMPANPLTLFNEFWTSWFDDFQYKASRRGVQLEEIQLKTLVLLDLEMRLASFEKRLPDFGLPTPTAEEIGQVEHVTCTQPAVIREELDYDYEELQRTIESSVPTFTPEQKIVYEEVMNAVKNDDSLCVFLSARGGCGKTYLLNSILSAVRTSEPGGCVALAMATTGIAATLLQLGRTFHSRMKAPLDPDATSTLSISAQSNLAELIRMAKVFLIDEATMLNKYLLEAMDRTLRDILMKPDLPFGGKIVILAGDFKQCLPVVPGASRAGIIKHAVNKSYLWQHFRVHQLTQNMRVHASGNPELEAFDKWGVEIGNGVENSIKVPIKMVATRITPNSKENPTTEHRAMQLFCDKIFPNLTTNIEDPNWINGRAILAPTNKEVQMLNEMLSAKLPGASEVMRSADQLTNTEGELRFNTEYLNTLTPSGFPPHSLDLKPGMPLMLMRNLNPRQGLCNGTKLIYEGNLDGKLLRCKISGSNRTVFIPRIIFVPKPGGIEWVRRQFPVKPAFAMTINKSQGKYFFILQISSFFFRSNIEIRWNLAALRCFHPWSTVCCLLQSWKARQSQVCCYD